MSLTQNDQQVLTRIFNAKSLDDVHTPKIDVTLKPDKYIDTAKVEELVEVEKESIKLFEEQEVDQALRLLDGLIEAEPRYASAYNNRAQIHRSLKKDCMNDLLKALELAHPVKNEPVSKMQATVLRSVYSQLASEYLRMSHLPENKSKSWNLQLKASEMLTESSNYGEYIYKQLAVAVNPYAKLCGNVMELVLRTEHGI